MTSLKSVEELIATKEVDEACDFASHSHVMHVADVTKLIKEDRQQTADVLCALLEGARQRVNSADDESEDYFIDYQEAIQIIRTTLSNKDL